MHGLERFPPESHKSIIGTQASLHKNFAKPTSPLSATPGLDRIQFLVVPPVHVYSSLGVSTVGRSMTFSVLPDENERHWSLWIDERVVSSWLSWFGIGVFCVRKMNVCTVFAAALEQTRRCNDVQHQHGRGKGQGREVVCTVVDVSDMVDGHLASVCRVVSRTETLF
jgi:hypothetical protein